MSNLIKLQSVLDHNRNNPKFSWLFSELEYWNSLNDEREEEDKIESEAELFMMDIAITEDELPYDKRYQIRKILIDAGFYRPFDEQAWKEGRIVVSKSVPWSFIMDKIKYDSQYTYYDFLDA